MGARSPISWPCDSISIGNRTPRATPPRSDTNLTAIEDDAMLTDTMQIRRVCQLTLGLMLLASPVAAEDSRCKHCGCQSSTNVCRLIQEEHSITVTCWGFQEEFFCLPGPSSPGCRHAEPACQECDPAGKTCFVPRRFTWWDWSPGECGNPHVKRKLMKRTVTKTVPSYKWVVEDLCDSCRANVGPVTKSPK